MPAAEQLFVVDGNDGLHGRVIHRGRAKGLLQEGRRPLLGIHLRQGMPGLEENFLRVGVDILVTRG